MYNTTMSKINKKQKIIIISVVSALLVITAIILFLCLFVFKPKSAPSVEVILAGEQVFVKVDESEKDYAYRFRFQENNNEVCYDSSTSVLNITEELWQENLKIGVQYNISVCYIDSGGVLCGDYSQPIEYTFNIKLSSPVLSLNENILSWEEVRGADYYNVSYYFIDRTFNISTSTLQFDLTTIPGGKYNVNVTSCSNKENFQQSQESQITVELNHNLMPFLSATINPQTFILTVDGNEYIPAIRLTDDVGNSYLLKDFSIEKSSNGWRYRIDVKAIYVSGRIYYVSPEPFEFNSYQGQTTKVSL